MEVFIKKLGKAVTVDWDALPAPIQAQVIDYGLKQKLSDGLSEMSVAKGNTVEEMTFTVNEAIATLMAGNWAARGRTADPVAARAKAIAKGLVAKYSRNALVEAMKAKNLDCSLDEFKTMLVRAFSIQPSTIAMAREQIAAEGAGEVDIDSLL